MPGAQPTHEAIALARRLRELREREFTKLTQSELGQGFADGDGTVSPAAVSMWENPASGRTPPPPRLEVYARLFCTPRSLDGGLHMLGLTELSADELHRMEELKHELLGLRDRAVLREEAPAPDQPETMFHFPVDAIVAMTKWNADMVKDYYGRNATRIIFPPIETKKLYNKQSRGYYLMVASLFPEARIDLVIKAFKKIPDKTLYIEGIGPAESYLKKIAGDSKNIKFLGRGNTSELRELYAKCIALLDVGYYRGFSMVMGEALASGKPCIAVNQGAYPEMIANNKTGAIVNPTVEGVIDGVSRITPDVAADMKKACLAKAKQFDLKSFYSGWDAVLKEAKNKVK